MPEAAVIVVNVKFLVNRAKRETSRQLLEKIHVRDLQLLVEPLQVDRLRLVASCGQRLVALEALPARDVDDKQPGPRPVQLPAQARKQVFHEPIRRGVVVVRVGRAQDGMEELEEPVLQEGEDIAVRTLVCPRQLFVHFFGRRHGGIAEDVLPGSVVVPEKRLAIRIEGEPRAVVVMGKDPQDDQVGPQRLSVHAVFQYRLIEAIAAHAHVQDFRRLAIGSLEGLFQVVGVALIVFHIGPPGKAVAQRDDTQG